MNKILVMGCSGRQKNWTQTPNLHTLFWITPLGVEIRYNISWTNDNELAVGFRSQHLQKDFMVPSASIGKS